MFSFHQNSQYAMTEEASRDMELLQYDILYGKRLLHKKEDFIPIDWEKIEEQDE